MRKFLFLNPFGIGDVLFTTPVLRAVKDRYQNSIIGYWSNQRVSAILERNPYIDKIFSLSRGDLKKIYKKSRLKGIREFLGLAFSIKRERFDTVIDFSLDHRYALLCKFLGIKNRIGFDYKKRGRFLTQKIPLDGYINKHVVEYYLEILDLLNIEPRDNKLDLFVCEEENALASSILSSYGVGSRDLVLGIAPAGGISWGKDAHYKHWPAENFAALADKLIKDKNAKVLILASQEEKDITQEMVKFMHEEAIDFTGKLSLRELAAMINNLNLLICNDGGPLHMAVSLGINTVSLYGPVDDEVYGPYSQSDRHIVIKKYLSCRPCYKNFRFTGCSNNHRCMEDINIEEVFSAVNNLLGD
jgi:lipopolysaccharide heptosyltransferase II